MIRRHLPNTFLSLRLDPVELVKSTPEQICETITRLVRESGNHSLTGVCCINLDQTATDAQINAIFDTVRELRQ